MVAVHVQWFEAVLVKYSQELELVSKKDKKDFYDTRNNKISDWVTMTDFCIWSDDKSISGGLVETDVLSGLCHIKCKPLLPQIAVSQWES